MMLNISAMPEPLFCSTHNIHSVFAVALFYWNVCAFDWPMSIFRYNFHIHHSASIWMNMLLERVPGMIKMANFECRRFSQNKPSILYVFGMNLVINLLSVNFNFSCEIVKKTRKISLRSDVCFTELATNNIFHRGTNSSHSSTISTINGTFNTPVRNIAIKIVSYGGGGVLLFLFCSNLNKI